MLHAFGLWYVHTNILCVSQRAVFLVVSASSGRPRLQLGVWVMPQNGLTSAGEQQQDSSDAASSKENRQQDSNMGSAPNSHTRLSDTSADPVKSKARSSRAASSKTRRSARLSGSNPNSATQDSASQVPAQRPTTRDSAAAASDAQGLVTQAPTAQESITDDPAAAAVTPVKAQQAKPADDLDKLLGSRLKSVRPLAEVQQTEEAPASPVTALRGQLRRVKLEPEERGSPLPRGAQEGVAGLVPASAGQVRPATLCLKACDQSWTSLQLVCQHVAS